MEQGPPLDSSEDLKQGPPLEFRWFGLSTSSLNTRSRDIPSNFAKQGLSLGLRWFGGFPLPLCVLGSSSFFIFAFPEVKDKDSCENCLVERHRAVDLVGESIDFGVVHLVRVELGRLLPLLGMPKLVKQSWAPQTGHLVAVGEAPRERC